MLESFERDEGIAEEPAELEEYVRVNSELMVLQSKARLSLKRANQPS